MLSLAFAKLVATPTDQSWSQVYNAGNLFASLSLSKKEADENSSLQAVGKEMFAALESEFFTLEEKSLETIKEAIANSTHTIPSNVTANLCVSYFKDNILYVFIFGKGAILMKRNEKVGVLLEEQEAELEIKSASGFLENGDVIILETPQFAKDMPEETISQALDLDLPNDIAEALSPAMHEKDDGGQASIIIKYQGTIKPLPLEEEQPADEIEQELGTNFSDNLILKEEEIEIVESDIIPPQTPQKSTPPKFQFTAFFGSLTKKLKNKPAFLQDKSAFGLDHRKKLFLSIALVILLLLIVSVSLTKKKQEDGKTAALFQSVYDPALKDYEDGLGIKSINKDFAHDDFLKAEKILKDNSSKFKKGSKEDKQISDLLTKVESELGGSASNNIVKPKAVDVGTNEFLNVEKANSDGLSFATDGSSTYFVTDKAVVSVDKSGAKKDVIKNNSDWEKPVGVAVYQSNIFILDQKKGVLKFVAGSDGFGKNSYFKTAPDLSNAVSIAIDGSVWILIKDGSILKYTRGTSDGFDVKGLDKPLATPGKIFTNTTTENLYVLDPSNSRIVKINKQGSFVTQYNAVILKSAKDLEVSEKDGKILVLSGNKIWEIPL